jgi:hypothetical protein
VVDSYLQQFHVGERRGEERRGEERRENKSVATSGMSRYEPIARITNTSDSHQVQVSSPTHSLEVEGGGDGRVETVTRAQHCGCRNSTSAVTSVG